MKKSNFLSLALVAVALFIGQNSVAQDGMMKKEKTVMVGGADMYPSKNIVENAVNSKDHTTLVAAVKAADLVETLSSEGPFTVFAPTNAAFDALPAGTVDTLLKPENKKALSGVLTYHVVAGKYSAADVIALIKKNNGKAVVKTLAGAELTLTLNDGKVVITDANGGTATVTIADVNQSNGVIHVVDAVLLPKM
ncbi:fasciclin domain-containing protein [Nonlabens mediterrranea]|uniref:Fasciclin domain-containing protein n=1 Tax=Nonlabens mediterrranea TaxID=1419947 RepID=A0ABS0A389_9FLAO|nr:fasciclin domain-containing protein [Nonlabens mediterrranea]